METKQLDGVVAVVGIGKVPSNLFSAPYIMHVSTQSIKTCMHLHSNGDDVDINKASGEQHHFPGRFSAYGNHTWKLYGVLFGYNPVESWLDT